MAFYLLFLRIARGGYRALRRSAEVLRDTFLTALLYSQLSWHVVGWSLHLGLGKLAKAWMRSNSGLRVWGGSTLSRWLYSFLCCYGRCTLPGTWTWRLFYWLASTTQSLQLILWAVLRESRRTSLATALRLDAYLRLLCTFAWVSPREC